MSEQIEKDKIEKDKIYNCDCLEDEVSPDNTGETTDGKGKEAGKNIIQAVKLYYCGELFAELYFSTKERAVKFANSLELDKYRRASIVEEIIDNEDNFESLFIKRKKQ